MKVKLKRTGQKPVQTIEIKGDFIRLDALLKFSGLTATGGEAKELILDSQITVNGDICIQRGKKIRPGDIVEYKQSRLTVVVSETHQTPANQTGSESITTNKA